MKPVWIIAAALLLFAAPARADICPAARNPDAYKHEEGRKFILPGRDGWLFRTRDFRPVEPLEAQPAAYLKRMNDTLAENGTRLVILFPPPRGMAAASKAEAPKGYDAAQVRVGYEAFLEQLRDTGIIAVGLPDANDAFYQKADVHWTVAGADMAAKVVAEEIRKLSAYDDMPKGEFVTEQDGTLPPGLGGYELTLQHICRLKTPQRTEPAWKTYRKDVGLLDEDTFPQVVTLGTSFTALERRFNFPGALKKYLRTDVYNAAVTGGGFDEAAVKYFASPEWRNHPPRVIVWEFQPMHDYNGEEAETALRRMLAEIGGGCTSRRTVYNPVGKTLTGAVVEVQGKAEFQALYADGNADRFMPGEDAQVMEIPDGKRPLFLRGDKLRVCGEVTP